MGIGNKIKEGNHGFLKRNNQLNKRGFGERQHNNKQTNVPLVTSVATKAVMAASVMSSLEMIAWHGSVVGKSRPIKQATFSLPT
jgi:hypothetical protein